MNNDFTPPADPWLLFSDWYELAKQHEPSYPNAMTLATIGASETPAARVVLMKDFDASGIAFYTNRDSAKGHELREHPSASVCFYWKSIQRQLRVDGEISLISDAESDAYFATRPRGSQIGAWASKQSQPLADRATLEQRVVAIEQQYQGKDVPRPPHWGGYLLRPTYFEFWQEREFRLHDRITYTRSGDSSVWAIGRIYP
jgi:pyridoxamine 5'-phosphate oxidase